MSISDPSVTIATVCGTPVDYEFVLGALWHHSRMAKYHVILDVTPKSLRRHWKNLPDNVIWIYDDSYQSGNWKTFRFRLALIQCLKYAVATGSDLILWIDSDEFVSSDAPEKLFRMVPVLGGIEHRLVTWGSDGMPYYKPTSYARRLWSAKLNVEFPRNTAWQKHPEYDGNPERHPILIWPKHTKVIKVDAFVHHHLHWTFKEKGLHSFGEFPIAPFPRDGKGVWPEPLWRWRFENVLPSKEFE